MNPGPRVNQKMSKAPSKDSPENASEPLKASPEGRRLWELHSPSRVHTNSELGNRASHFFLLLVGHPRSQYSQLAAQVNALTVARFPLCVSSTCLNFLGAWPAIPRWPRYRRRAFAFSHLAALQLQYVERFPCGAANLIKNVRKTTLFPLQCMQLYLIQRASPEVGV